MEFAVYTLMAFMEVELKFLFWPENSLIHSNIISAYIARILALNYQQLNHVKSTLIGYSWTEP